MLLIYRPSRAITFFTIFVCIAGKAAQLQESDQRIPHDIVY